VTGTLRLQKCVQKPAHAILAGHKTGMVVGGEAVAILVALIRRVRSDSNMWQTSSKEAGLGRLHRGRF